MVLVAAGAALVVAGFADLFNTLVATSTATGRFWPSRWLGYRLFALLHRLVGRLPEDSRTRELALAGFGPGLLFVLLVLWIVLQIFGFALIWTGLGGVAGIDGLGEASYFSAVVYFTVGFGEIVPDAAGTRAGTMVEAGMGVVTIALVVGYLPSLYAAYSEREQKLMLIDDGTGGRITPTALVLAWSPEADTARLNARMADWEEWVARIQETHATLPLLPLFRSHDRRQNWITALGLLCDVAVHAQLIVGCSGRTESYWFLRRAIALFDDLTEGADLSDYQQFVREPGSDADDGLLDDIYVQLSGHGYELLSMEEGRERARRLRNRFAPQMEFMIDTRACPRGFWSPELGPEIDDLDRP